MPSTPLVSVIIIFFNAEKFLAQAIRSVLGQSYSQWELLLVDDGSNDTSSLIAKQYSIDNPKQIYYLEHPGHANLGMSASRNLGIQQSRGEFIGFLDADDLWLPKKLQEQTALLEAHEEAVMVYGRSKYWFSWTGTNTDQIRDQVQPHGIGADQLYFPPELLPLYLRGEAAIPPPTSILARRRAIEAVDRFEVGFKDIYEDQVFYAKLCLHAPIFVASPCWDYYRQHPDSSTSMVNVSEETLYAARLRYLDWLETYLRQYRHMEPDVWLALRQELWLFSHYRGAAKFSLSAPAMRVVRIAKKWVLRAERLLLPTKAQRILWLR